MRVWARLTARPLVTVALVGLLLAAYQVWTIHRERHLGTFDLDESGYLARALSMHRELGPRGPGGVWAVLPTDTGPLVPLLSVPFLLVHPRSAQSAMAVQPLLHLVAAVAVAGIARRLAGAQVALVAGLVTLGLPVALIAARGYRFEGAAAATLALAVWALLASERGEKGWPMVGFGVAVAAMLLARVMTIAFLPALAVACGIQLPRSARALRNLGLALLAFLLVAAPWWLDNAHTIWSYLRSRGFSPVAERFGPESPGARVRARARGVVTGARPLLLVPMALAVLGGFLGRRRSGSGTRAVGRDLVTVWLVVGIGYAALLSSANIGVRFDLPLIVLAVAGVAGLAPLVPRPWGRPVAAVAVVAALLNMALVGQVRWAPVRSLFSAEDGKAGDLSVADPRFGWTAPVAERDEAAAEWWKVSVDIAWTFDRMEGASPVDLERTAIGSSRLLSANSVLLAEEIASQGQRPITEIDANTPARDFLELATPEREGRPNVLLVLDVHRAGERAGGEIAEVLDAVARSGWVDLRTFALPDGGRAHILTHPASWPP